MSFYSRENTLRNREQRIKESKDYYQIGDKVAYATNNELHYGYILRFEAAPQGTLVVLTQDKFYNTTGRSILRRPDQILFVEE